MKTKLEKTLHHATDTITQLLLCLDRPDLIGEDFEEYKTKMPCRKLERCKKIFGLIILEKPHLIIVKIRIIRRRFACTTGMMDTLISSAQNSDGLHIRLWMMRIQFFKSLYTSRILISLIRKRMPCWHGLKMSNGITVLSKTRRSQKE